jgi:hypothetical protein
MKTLTHSIRFALAAALLVCALPLRSLAATPTATSFSTAVPANRQSVIQLQGADADGTALTFATLSSPSHGALTNLNASTGTVVYTPTAGYTGADSFTYKVTSGGQDSTTATVTITVSNAKTVVTDTITDPSGSPRQGKVTFILTQAVATPAGLTPAGTSVSAPLNSSGSFSVQLYPSRGMNPQAYYQVWFAPSDSINGQLLGVYDIPLSTTPVGLAAYRVTDTNLAARYTFASVAGLEALVAAVTNAAVLLLMAESRTVGKLQYWDGSMLSDSLVSQSESNITLGGATSVSGNLTVNGAATATGGVTAGSLSTGGALSAQSASVTNGVTTNTVTASGTVTSATIITTAAQVNGLITAGAVSTGGALTVTGEAHTGPLEVNGAASIFGGVTASSLSTGGTLTARDANVVNQITTGSVTASGTVAANKFVGDGSELSGIAGATGGVSNAVNTNIAAATSGTGSINFSTNNVTRASLSADGKLTGTAIDDLLERPTAMRFDGGSNMQHVDYGPFFDARRTDLGPMLWEFWAMPGNNAYSRYMLSDGYAGEHAVLFGFTSSSGSRYAIYFNTRCNGAFTELVTSTGPMPNEWGHYAVAYDGGQAVIYYNGIAVAQKACAGPRTSFAPGGGRNFIGGSDHNNFDGLIQQVRGFEGINAKDDSGNFNPLMNSFVPATVFQKTVQGPSGALYRASFLTSFRKPRDRPLDESDYQNHGRRHTLPFTGGFLNGVGGRTGALLPTFVFDPNAPGVAGATAPVGTPNAAGVCPAGTLICDSFTRPNSLRIYDGLAGLGSTEGGTRGPLAWDGSADPSDPSAKALGILNGVVVITNNVGASAFLDAGQTDVDIRVDRLPQPDAGNAGKHTSIAFSYNAARTEGCEAVVADSSADQFSPSTTPALRLACKTGGVETVLANYVALPSTTWTTLRVVRRSDGSIRVYVGNGASESFSEVGSGWTSATGIANTHVGFVVRTLSSGLQFRADNFQVRPAP